MLKNEGFFVEKFCKINLWKMFVKGKIFSRVLTFNEKKNKGILLKLILKKIMQNFLFSEI